MVLHTPYEQSRERKEVEVIEELRVSAVLNVWAGDSEQVVFRSIRSIARQTLPPAELIVVIDGPCSIDVMSILGSFRADLNCPTTVVELGSNVGLAMARNAGISAASHELVALHDADDVMHPMRLRRMANKIASSKSDAIFCQAVEFDSLTELVDVARITPIADRDLRIAMMKYNAISHSTALVRKSSMLSVGGYRDIWRMEDYELWLRLLANQKKLEVLDEVLQAISRDQNYLMRRKGIAFLKSELHVCQTALKMAKGVETISVLFSSLRRIAFRLLPDQVQQMAYRGLRNRRSCAKVMTLSEFEMSSLKWSGVELVECPHD